MFTESMFSTPHSNEGEPSEEALSAWPAVAAASFACLIALMRLVIGHIRQESLDLDLVLAAGATVLIPAIVLLFWLNARPFRRVQRLAQRPLSRRHEQLSLVAPLRRSQLQAMSGRPLHGRPAAQ